MVRFTTGSGEERTFTDPVGTSPPEHAVGEVVQVAYEPTDPAGARIRSFWSMWGLAAILACSGFLVSLCGARPLVCRSFASRRAADLRRRGMRVQAVIQRVERHARGKAYGRTPWRIVCHWVDPATGQLHVFESENIWFDPGQHLRGKEVTVYVDPQDSRRYTVDASYLPSLPL